MKTIVQNCETGEYLTASGVWSADEREALGFPSSLQALDYCWRKKIGEAVLVLKFADPRFDIQLHPFEKPKESPLAGAPWESTMECCGLAR